MLKKTIRLRLVIVAIIVFYASLITAAAIRLRDSVFLPDRVLISDILSKHNNPEGAWIAILGINICVILLYPVTQALQINQGKRLRTASLTGRWMFFLGILSIIALSLTSLLDEGGYSDLHVWMAYASFMGVVGGLTIGFTINFLSGYKRLLSLTLTMILLATFSYLAYLFTQPEYFNGRLWLLAVYEWMLSAIISAGIIQIVWMAKH
ncbi:hypothetical protein FNH22_03495 [Fulvivirga sp. M361]|uniref:hypothetical protein n=1 Tax=Fulvivirga sp. M361 TaxID=2594266 RepID=UPI00117BD0C7|nr:hypothetical protein [Fulvivirga sp. M361]TRX61852.1 hypothetical protein FNH22_03495 [Fulvivirga sp. M361]